MNGLIAAVDWWALFVDGAITGLIFVVTMIVGTLLVGLVLVRMPAHYFCDHYVRDFWVDRHPFIRAAGRVLRNLLGVLMLAVGVFLALPAVPGPGLPIMVFGVTLVDFPGKRRWERWLVGRPAVLKGINKLRRRYGQPPMVLECVAGGSSI